jgi:hypothetical protein
VPLSADSGRLPKAGVWSLGSGATSPASSSQHPMSPPSPWSSFSADAGQRQVVADRLGVWNANAHLYFIETLHQYCRVFRQESWAALYFPYPNF